VASGSRLFRPNIPGLSEHSFSVDSLEDAVALDKHLHGLAKRPATNGRNTVVVVGGGFTGIEAATEIQARLRGILGQRCQDPRHHRRPQQRDRARHGPGFPPRH
jgi:NADH dehydrogenase